MFDVGPGVAATYLVTWLGLGGIIGLLAGLGLRRWFHASSRFAGLSIFLGVLGSLAGLVVCFLGRLESTEVAVVLGAFGLTFVGYALSSKAKVRGNDANA